MFSTLKMVCWPSVKSGKRSAADCLGKCKGLGHALVTRFLHRPSPRSRASYPGLDDRFKGGYLRSIGIVVLVLPALTISLSPGHYAHPREGPTW